MIEDPRTLPRLAAAAFGVFGGLLGCGGLFIGSAVLAVALRQFPGFDYLTAAIALALLAAGALLLREAWRRWKAAA